MLKVINLGSVRGSESDEYIGRGDFGKNHLLNTPPGVRGWLGNPFLISDANGVSREEAIQKFRIRFKEKLRSNTQFYNAVLEIGIKARARGDEPFTLGCYCSPAPCHGDVIVEFLNDPDVFLHS